MVPRIIGSNVETTPKCWGQIVPALFLLSSNSSLFNLYWTATHSGPDWTLRSSKLDAELTSTVLNGKLPAYIRAKQFDWEFKLWMGTRLCIWTFSTADISRRSPARQTTWREPPNTIRWAHHILEGQPKIAADRWRLASTLVFAIRLWLLDSCRKMAPKLPPTTKMSETVIASWTFRPPLCCQTQAPFRASNYCRTCTLALLPQVFRFAYS